MKGEPLDIKLSANPSANPSLNYGIVLRAAKAELKLFDLPLPRTCTSSVLATGDGDAALSLIWALALHWYLSRIEGIADKRCARMPPLNLLSFLLYLKRLFLLRASTHPESLSSCAGIHVYSFSIF